MTLNAHENRQSTVHLFFGKRHRVRRNSLAYAPLRHAFHHPDHSRELDFSAGLLGNSRNFEDLASIGLTSVVLLTEARLLSEETRWDRVWTAPALDDEDEDEDEDFDDDDLEEDDEEDLEDDEEDFEDEDDLDEDDEEDIEDDEEE
jgi:hypothetical protein